MKFVMTVQGLAQVPKFVERGIEDTTNSIGQSISNAIASWLQSIGEWLATDGIVLAAELALVWGMICFLIACSGEGKWITNGTKSILISIGLGVARLAIPL